MTKDELIEFFQAPGLSTKEKGEQVREFLTSFKHMLEIYRPVFGDPLGLTVDAHIDTASWYINWHTPGSTKTTPE